MSKSPTYEPKIIENVTYDGGNGFLETIISRSERGFYTMSTTMYHFGVPLAQAQPLPDADYVDRIIIALTTVRDEIRERDERDRPYAYFSGHVSWLGGEVQGRFDRCDAPNDIDHKA